MNRILKSKVKSSKIESTKKGAQRRMKFKKRAVVYQKPKIFDKFTFFVFILIILTIEILFIIFTTKIPNHKRSYGQSSPASNIPTPTIPDTLETITSDLQKIPLP
jgi:hypothetical protein